MRGSTMREIDTGWIEQEPGGIEGWGGLEVSTDNVIGREITRD